MQAANRWNAWILCVAGAVSATGCNVVDASKSLFATNANPTANASVAGPTAVVEYRSSNGATKSVAVPVDGDDFHVQQLMDKTGAFRKFSRSEVELQRKTPQGRQTKMSVSYDRGNRRIEPQCDYQVLPGDVLVVTEDPTNLLDDMLGKVSPTKKKSSVKGSIRG